jgi:hypothetical protein
MDRADVGMIQGRGGLGLTPKTFQSLAVLRKVFREEFERNKSLKARVLGLVDHTHAAIAELLQNAVVRHGLPDQ